MSQRARAIVCGLVLTFAVRATPLVNGQSIVAQPAAPTSQPAAQDDASPFRPTGDASTAFPTSRPARAATSDLSSLGFDVGRMLAAMVIVLALIGLAYWAARKLAGRGLTSASTRAVKVLSRTPLSPRQQVLLLQVGRRVIVVGDSAGQMTSLAHIDDADEVAQLLGQIEGEQMRKATSFGGAFRKSQRSFDEPAADAHASHDAEPPADVGDLDHQRSELSGLLDKVRALRGQIDK